MTTPKGKKATTASNVADVSDITAEAQRYFDAMQAAHQDADKNGGTVEDYIGDYMDEPGLAALEKFKLSVGNAASSPKDGIPIPMVTKKEAGGERGYDLFSLLLTERILLLEGGVDASMAAIASAALFYLNAQDSEAEIKVYIDSPGGSISAGLAIYDAMRFIDAPITTIGLGMQASMGSVLLAAGDTRAMTENSMLLLHQGSSGAEGQPTDIAIGADHMDRLLDKLRTIYQDHIGLTREYWGIVLNRDTWFSAEQALKMGFIDQVLHPPAAKKARYASEKSLTTEFMKAKEDVAARYDTVSKIRAVINSDGAPESRDVAYSRPELAVALAQFPEFWTPGLKAEKEQEARAARAANGNTKATKMTGKASSGPA